MSTVATSVFPNTPLVLNELEAVTQPAGVHPKHLMLLCNQQEVSSLTELKQTLPRCVWPHLYSYTYTVNAYIDNFFDLVSAGTTKYIPVIPLTVQWSGTPRHNVFRIAISMRYGALNQAVTEELLREQDDYWPNLMRLRLEYYANIVESILLYRLLVERAVLLGAVPRSYIAAFAGLTAAALQAEAGTENIYFMISALRYGVAMRQAPMRLGSAGFIIFNQETPKFVVVPVAVRLDFAPFANRIVCYTDYLTKTTTRYFINKFRIDRNKNSTDEQNLYKVLYERYVSYALPVFTSSGQTHTWAFSVSANNVHDVLSVDEAGGWAIPDQNSILIAGNAVF